MYINLISGPRNISTALMYSFAQRRDTQVLDEPYYAVYLLATGLPHPGREDVLRDQPTTQAAVESWIQSYPGTPVVFIKNMAHHMQVLKDPQWLYEQPAVFLIRNPRQIIASYAQVIDNPDMRDIGIEYQYTLFELFRQGGKNPLVLDSGLVLQNPSTVLTALCEALAIPYDSAMLQWKAGPKPYDGVWAPHWYANVHQSTGFEKQVTSERALRPDLQDLYEQAKAIYDKMIVHALTP